MSPDRHTSGSVFTRSGPLVAVIAIHAAIIYLLAVSMGVVDAPKFVQPVQAVFIPEPTAPEPETPKIKPQIAEVAPPTAEPPPEIQFDEPPVVPVAENPMPASESAIAATTAIGQSATELKTSSRVEPTYPPASRRAGEEGTVRLKVLVDANGRAKDVQVAKSSGSARLDEAAQQAVRRWKFIAANDGTKAIPIWTQVAITFRLTDGR